MRTANSIKAAKMISHFQSYWLARLVSVFAHIALHPNLALVDSKEPEYAELHVVLESLKFLRRELGSII